MSEVQNLSIQTLLDAYDSGLETPQSLISRLRSQAESQSEYNAWIYLLSENELQVYLDALMQKPKAQCPLWGIPFAIKDNIDLANVPTTAACEAYAHTPSASAKVVELLVAAGAIPLGKTNLDQFATGLVGTRSPYGEGKNVFNPDYISGGSSAGSAIATALGQVSFALGTDTAGSGRVPAAFNNLIGHKPSKGLISNRGVVPACQSLDCVSIFALSAEDAATVLDAAIATDREDPYSRPNQSFNTHPYWRDTDIKRFRFGVPEELILDEGNDSRRLFQIAVDKLVGLGGTPVPLNMAPFLSAARLLYEGPWVAERALSTSGVDRSTMLPVIQKILASTDDFTVTDAFAAQYKLQALKKQCDDELGKLDFALIPTTPGCYSREDIAKDPIALNSRLGTYTNFMNLLDYAATAVPVGQLTSAVSWGVTLFSAAHQDIRLLSFAGALHKTLDLALGATPHKLNESQHNARPIPETSVEVVVCGAHLQGQPLNWQLTDRSAVLRYATTTIPSYALYALPDGKRPALVQRDSGCAIEVEVWQMPMSEFGSFVAGIPSPLGIGKVLLDNGESLPGFICEEGGISDALDISHYGGWRAYLAACSN